MSRSRSVFPASSCLWAAALVLPHAGCGCKGVDQIELEGSVVAAEVRLPDNGESPGLVLEVFPKGEIPSDCHFALYEFEETEAVLTESEIVAASAGSPVEQTEFGGVLLRSGVLPGEGGQVVEGQLVVGLRAAEKNPYRANLVWIMCPERDPANAGATFDASTNCAAEQRVLRGEPEFSDAVVEIVEG